MKVTYSFADSKDTYNRDLPSFNTLYRGTTELDGFDKFQNKQINAANDILQSFSHTGDITFALNNPSQKAAIRYANTSGQLSGASSKEDVYGEAAQPNSITELKKNEAGDVWISKTFADTTDFKAGSKGYFLILHETGHALGLKHPNEGGHQDARLDSVVNTIMSVRAFNTPENLGLDPKYFPDQSNLSFYPTTPMPYDIAALQFIYGVNWEHAKEDTTYKFVPEQQFYETIWDAGGDDTIDFSAATTNTYISLLSGDLKDSSGTKTSEIFDTPDQKTYKLLIAFEPDVVPAGKNVLIENAIGGSGDDFLEGNKANNKLVGYGGPAPTIVNGGFETGTTPPPSVYPDGNGSRPLLKDNTDLDGWTVGDNGVDWTGGLWRAAGGTKSIDLSGTTPTGTDKSGSISQEIQGLVLGKSYTVGFQLSGNFQGGDNLKEGKLSIDGQKYAFDFARPANWSEGKMGWVDRAFTFTFQGTDSVLKFESDDPSFYGPVIDNVRIYETDDSAESGGADTLVGGGGDDTLVGSARLDRLYGSYRHPDPRDDPRDADDGDGIDIFKIVADEIPPYVKVEDKPINNTILYGFGHRMGGRDHYGNADKIDLTEFGDGDWKLIHSGDALAPGTIKVANHDIRLWTVDGYAVSQLFGKDKDGDYFQLFIDDGKANGWDYRVEDFIGVTSAYDDLWLIPPVHADGSGLV